MKIGLRELTFFLLLVGILAGAAYFVFLPHWRQVEQVRKETMEKQARLNNLGQLGQSSEALTKELADLTQALEFFESKLPDNQQIHSVLREVTQITEKHGLTTKSVRTLKQVESPDYVAQPIEMDLSGGFPGFYQFLLDLRKLPRITKIGQMELAKDKVAEGVVQTKMVLTIYFEPPAKGTEASGGGAGGSRPSAPAPPARREAPRSGTPASAGGPARRT